MTAPINVRTKVSSEIANREGIPGDPEKKLSEAEASAGCVKGIINTRPDTNRISRRVTMVPIHQKPLSIKLFL
jgi:hypothetical protein